MMICAIPGRIPNPVASSLRNLLASHTPAHQVTTRLLAEPGMTKPLALSTFVTDVNSLTRLLLI